MNNDFRVSIDPLIEPTPGSAAEMDRLGDEIAALSAHLDAATARLLDLIRDFDAGGGWGNGFRSCAQWLSWRVGLDPGTARERVRVARLGALPGWPRRLPRLLAVGRAGTAEHVPAGTFPADVSAEPPTMAEQQADALGLLAESALHHGIEPGAPGERYQVVVHVDAPVLTDPGASGQSVLDDGVHVSAETSRRLACDATRVVMRHDPDGQVTEVGARTRTIPPALRRPLRCRTSHCCVAGITAWFTRPDIGWSDSLTGSCASGDRMVDHCPTCRRPPSFPPTPSTRCARGTTRRGCASERLKSGGLML